MHFLGQPQGFVRVCSGFCFDCTSFLTIILQPGIPFCCNCPIWVLLYYSINSSTTWYTCTVVVVHVYIFRHFTLGRSRSQIRGHIQATIFTRESGIRLGFQITRWVQSPRHLSIFIIFRSLTKKGTWCFPLLKVGRKKCTRRDWNHWPRQLLGEFEEWSAWLAKYTTCIVQ